jgi:V-type H+-transporting ATPase subunit C
MLLYGELYLSYMHLKVMRVYIDGVLRFGIPPTFHMFCIDTQAGSEKKILDTMIKEFADPT